jgi:hypothetical protein
MLMLGMDVQREILQVCGHYDFLAEFSYNVLV